MVRPLDRRESAESSIAMELRSNDEVPSRAPQRESPDGAGERRTALWSIPLVLFILLVVFFWPVLTPNSAYRSHIGGDLLIKDYPFRLYAIRVLISGRLPLWDEHLFGGWPALANSELAVLYPPNLLLVPFWSERGFSYLVFEWWILLHLFFAGLGTARLGRRYGLSLAGALLAGTVMMCSGFLVAHKIHSNIIQTIVWLPWVLLGVEGFLPSGRMARVWVCGGCLICAYLGGHPQMAIYLTLVVAFRLLWEIAVTEAVDRRTAIRRSAFVVFAVLAAALTSMAQWLPTRDLVVEGERSIPTYQSSAEYSLPAKELVDTFLPEPTRIPGIHGVQEDYVGVEVFYWGVATLLLALLCFPVVRLRGPAGFLLLAGVLALVLALGSHTAAHRWAYAFVPGIAWLRASSRWIVVVTLAIALAAGRGLDAVTRDRIFDNARIARVYSVLGASFLFCVLIVLLLVTTQRFFMAGEVTAETSPLLNQLVWILICLVLVAGALALHALGKLPAAALAAVILLSTFWDLATVHGSREIKAGPGGFTWDEAVQTIRSDPTPGRVKIRFGPGGLDRRQYSGHVFGFREVDGESPLKTRDSIAQRSLTSLEDPLRINHAFFDLLCTEYILADLAEVEKPWERISEHLWRSPAVSPAVRWYGSYLTVDSGVIPSLLTSQTIPFDRVAVVGTDPLAPPQWGARTIPNTTAALEAPFLALSVSAEGIRHQAAIVFSGRNYAENKTGYNIVVIDPDSNEVTASESFNTMADYKPDVGVVPGTPENTRMARFIEAIPNGHIVIAAVREEGTNILQASAVKALQSCGSGVDLRKRWRLAHTLVGRKGMPPGTALEVVGATEALVMTDPDGGWLRSPAPPVSPAKVSLESRHLDAQRIWERVQDSPPSLPPSASYRICDGTALLRLPVIVFSSPKDDSLPADRHWDRAGLIIGASDWSRNKRGYNLAAFDPLTGEILAAGSFDTTLDWNAAAGAVIPGTPENSRMIRFLDRVPTGAAVVGAVRDEGCNLLQPETVAALRTVGCQLDLQRKFRWAHAFMGIKGARPGSAVEIASSTHVVIYTAVTGSPIPELDTSLPSLRAQRITELEALGIPVLTSRGTREAIGETLPETSGGIPSAESIQPAPPGFPKALETDLRRPSVASQWSMRKPSPEEFEIVGSATAEGILFVSEPFFPGWRAYLDGEETEMFRVFGHFRGVRVPPGPHQLRMRYQPVSVIRGGAFSCLGLILWIGWGVWLLSNRSARRNEMAS